MSGGEVNGLAVFCRAPIQGKCKTRLFSTLGEAGALKAHVELTRGALARMREFNGVKVLWSSEDHDLARDWAQEFGFDYAVQEGADIGERMANALQAMLTSECSSACLVGSDCPPIDATYAHEALKLLHYCDLVFGPAEDGGYGLIGMEAQLARRADSSLSNLFKNISWGTSKVMAQSHSRANEQNLSVGLLTEIWDVDTPSDWQRYLAQKNNQGFNSNTESNSRN
ncbi:MAG: rSAM/selenodomain-associated transferase 1 [Candidatus Azotimanducaceae bacterium]